MKLPKEFLKEYSFKDLSDWCKINRPELAMPAIIEMTYDQEQWYRQLLNPKFAVERIVTFNGIPIIVYEI